MIILALEIEKSNPQIPRVVVKTELQLCAKLLAKDERNFHVWNYRNWIINATKSFEQKAIDNELAFIDSKLKENFSNFSALHFKSKTVGYKCQQFLEQNLNHKISELTSEDKIKVEEILIFGYSIRYIVDELQQVKTGLFMQSSEQSMWLYHKYLIDLLIPIQVNFTIWLI